MRARLRDDRRGGVSILTAISAMALIGCAALGVDIGMLTLSQRKLQGVADQAALAAVASSPERRAEAVQRLLATNGLVHVSSTLAIGTYRADRSIAPENRFATGADGGAIRVVLRQPVRLFFGRVLTGDAQRPVAASAVARRVDLAAFSLGTRLAQVQDGLPGALLSGLAGSNLSLSLLDYRALVDTRIELLPMIKALGTRLNLTGASYNEILAADVTLPTLLNAMADTTGQAGTATLLRRLALRVPGSPVPLTRLIDLGPLGDATSATSRDLIGVDAYSMLRESLAIANGRRQVALDLGASVPGLVSTRVLLAIGERPAASPWLAVTRDGSTTVRTAQQRLLVDTQIGVPFLANIQLPLFVETASAQARLNAVRCTGTTPTVTVDSLPSPGTLAVAQVDRTLFDDMNRAPITGAATLLQIPLAKVMGHARIDLASDTAWQHIHFDQTDIANAMTRTVTANSAVRGIAQSLIRQVDLQLVPLGIPIGLGGLTGAVGAALLPVAPALDLLIGNLTDLMGLHVGQADVTINGVRCGGAVLVA
ncbi:pilus assembly protein TadG-related protein [Sphingomonas sp. NCPPB 2930]|uniref:pilus assembly protein TadG-related protein n=1 Tax=Sphingomonas sp. NCPPB 2930 TaxID=3162788 RepID=UPI0036DD25E7